MTRKTVDLRLDARWMVPLRPARVILEHHSVIVQGDRIVDVLGHEEADARYDADTVVHLNDHVLTPGLINTHCHAPMSLLRGYQDDADLHSWLADYIWPAENRWVNRAFVHDGSRLAIAEMLLRGITCFSDMYFFPEEVAAAAAEMHMRMQAAFPIVDFPNAWSDDAGDAMRKGLQLYDRFRGHPLIQVAFGPHSVYTVSDDMLDRIAVTSAEIDAGVQIHLHETELEVRESVQATGKRPITRLAEHGLLNPRLQCVHMVALDQQDMDLIAHHGCHVLHCPESNMKLASGFMPIAELQRRGVNIAVGTDGPASNNDLDVLSEARSAALIAKGTSGDAGRMDLFQTLEMATLAGARALGQEDNIGSIEVGKQADIAAWDLNHVWAQPVLNPLSQLINCNLGPASHVWVGGRPVVAGHLLMTADSDAIIAAARVWAQRLNDGKQLTGAAQQALL